jgi:hypothetical protein
MGPISCARPLPPVTPQSCCAKIDFGPSANFADCPSDKFCQQGNVWVDVLRLAIVPRCLALLHEFAVEFVRSVHAFCSLVPTLS